jgi:hypothetical protein
MNLSPAVGCLAVCPRLFGLPQKGCFLAGGSAPSPVVWYFPVKPAVFFALACFLRRKCPRLFRTVCG